MISTVETNQGWWTRESKWKRERSARRKCFEVSFSHRIASDWVDGRGPPCFYDPSTLFWIWIFEELYPTQRVSVSKKLNESNSNVFQFKTPWQLLMWRKSFLRLKPLGPWPFLTRMLDVAYPFLTRWLDEFPSSCTLKWLASPWDGFPVENSKSECLKSSQGERAQLCTDCQIASSRPRMGHVIVIYCSGVWYICWYTCVCICVYIYIFICVYIYYIILYYIILYSTWVYLWLYMIYRYMIV